MTHYPLRLGKLSFVLLGALSLLGSVQAQTLTLRWWDYYTDGANNNAISDLVSRYEAAHPDVAIERTTIGFGDLKARIIQAAATGTMPDILIVDNPDHQAMAAQGALADITDYISSWEGNGLYFEGPWSSTVYQGSNYGVPYGSNATALYYNQDLFEEFAIEAPPSTWEELREAARTLTAPDRSGFCFSAVPTEEGTFTVLPFLWQAGGDIPTIGDRASTEMLSFLNALMNEDGSVSRAAVTWGQGDVYNQFIAGRCAMMINGPWQLPLIRGETLAFSWEVAPWPCQETCASSLGGENFALGAGGNLEAAWEVINWVTRPENLKPALLTSGYLPNRSDMAEDPDFLEDPAKEVFLDMVAIARARAYGPGYPEISEHIMTMVQNVLAGGQSPEAAAQEAAAAIGPLLP